MWTNHANRGPTWVGLRFPNPLGGRTDPSDVGFWSTQSNPTWLTRIFEPTRLIVLGTLRLLIINQLKIL